MLASQVPASLNAAGLPNSINVIVENRGTEDLFNSTLTVNTAGQQQTYNIPHLEVGQVETVNVVAPEHTGSQSLSISSSIRNTSGDLNRADSSRSETFTIEN